MNPYLVMPSLVSFFIILFCLLVSGIKKEKHYGIKYLSMEESLLMCSCVCLCACARMHVHGTASNLQ